MTPDDPVLGLAAQAYALQSGGEAAPSEDEMALAFSATHDDLRYVAKLSRWFLWDGTRWDEDSTLAVYDRIRSMIRETTDKRSARNAATVAGVERLAKSDRRHATVVEAWDTDDWALNTPAGIVDLHSGDVVPHAPARYCTKITATSPGGECPMWQQFLEEVTDRDEELQEFLQRMIGYALTGSIREHALFFLYGTGRNGKGVFINTLTSILGDYASVAPMEAFTETRSERHPTELAMLRAARLVTAQETEDGRRWAESRIKALTGGDPVTARYMRQDFFTYQPKFKLIIAGNHKPRLSSVDEAMRARLNLVPFTVTIPREKRDPDLQEKLKAEWPGILQWAIQGCQEYLRIGLKPPRAVTEATDEYFSAEDVFGQWLRECCERGKDYWARPTPLFNSWRAYAEAANEYVGTQKRFVERMLQEGFREDKKRAYAGRAYVGIRLLPDDGLEVDW